VCPIPSFVNINTHNFLPWKKVARKSLVFFKKLPKESNHPICENSANPVTLVGINEVLTSTGEKFD
jgi:hypothetical protein